MRARPPVIAGIAFLALCSTICTTSSAAADSSRCAKDCAGKASFTSYGEIFHVLDRKADGHSVVVLYWLPDGTGPHKVWNSKGNGSDVKANLELAEGSWITYRVCLGEYGARKVLTSTCGSTITDYA